MEIPIHLLFRQVVLCCEFVAVNTSGSFSGVESMGEIPNQNLHALNGIDMVIIVPDRTAFVQQAERLAQVHREKDGLTVEVVKASQIYNEFSSGNAGCCCLSAFDENAV